MGEVPSGMERIIDSEPENCPDCSNQGWYYIGIYGEQEQCEWCYTNPNSVFNQAT
jgi:hypothetical protein